MDAPIAQLPDEPGVDRAERQLAVCSARTRIRHVIQQPLEFGAGKIGIDDEPRFRGDRRFMTRGAKLIAQWGRTPVLPHDGVGDWAARCALPYDRGLALIGDADRGDVACADSCLGEDFVHNTRLRRPDFGRVVLDPTRLRKDLREFLLCTGADGPVTIEHDRARTRRTLIEGEDDRHRNASAHPVAATRQRRVESDVSAPL